MLGIVAVLTRQSLRLPRPSPMPTIAAAGVLDVTANAVYLLATRRGLLALVAVISALYPASTVLLARVILHERLARLQVAGLVVAGAGVVLIAAG
jgi:drug/metabolite transporter (DMT)-like permease